MDFLEGSLQGFWFASCFFVNSELLYLPLHLLIFVQFLRTFSCNPVVFLETAGFFQIATPRLCPVAAAASSCVFNKIGIFSSRGVLVQLLHLPVIVLLECRLNRSDGESQIAVARFSIFRCDQRRLCDEQTALIQFIGHQTKQFAIVFPVERNFSWQLPCVC